MYIKDFTCFSVCEEYRISEMRDCTLHISRFCSLRRTAVVMQIPVVVSRNSFSSHSDGQCMVQ